MQRIIKLQNLRIGNDLPFTLIAGPCQIEGRDHALFMAEKHIKLTAKLNIPFIYKSSFDKANRTSINGVRGLRMDVGLEVLAKVKRTFNCHIVTDVHSENQCTQVAKIVDILAVPVGYSNAPRIRILVNSGYVTRYIDTVCRSFFIP